jgi:hypothetical protein
MLSTKTQDFYCDYKISHVFQNKNWFQKSGDQELVKGVFINSYLNIEFNYFVI